MNPQWKVRPKISFIDGTTKILTCEYHDGGDARMMIHECHWKHHVPHDQPDKVSQLVTQIKTIRKGKESLYSTKYITI